MGLWRCKGSFIYVFIYILHLPFVFSWALLKYNSCIALCKFKMYNMLIWYDILIFFKMIITITLTPPSRHIITVSFFMWECLRATFLATFQYIVQYRSNCQHLLDHQKKARKFQKNIYFCFIDYTKAFDHVDHNKL